jgi:RNA polymerase sigma-70 factor (family 1)
MLSYTIIYLLCCKNFRKFVLKKKMVATLNTLTDLELVDLLKSEGYAAFTEIYNRYWDKLFAVAYYRLDDELEAEETVQNVFLSLWKRRDNLELTHSLSTYLSVAVKYQVITKLALLRRKQQHINSLSKTEEGIETTTNWLSEKELKIQIQTCINQLPEKCRIVFQLSREQGKTNAQIAHELEISEKTVEGHITKALHTLRGSLNISIPLLLILLKK